MASSSSTKRAAKLAQRGQGRSVRFQGGTLFPLVVGLVLVLGFLTIIYARESRPEADASPPTINDHWHAAYGFYLCDPEADDLQFDWYQVQGDKEEVNSQGALISTEFLRTGIHSHNDGVIHWHPYTSAAVGQRAKLGVFLDVYGVELDNDSLTFPEDQPVLAGGSFAPESIRGQNLDVDDVSCGGEDVELTVVVWDSFSDTDDGDTFITSFDDIRIANDGMVFSIAMAPRDTDIPMPPWAADLPVLGAADTNQLRPEDLLVDDTTVEADPAAQSSGDG